MWILVFWRRAQKRKEGYVYHLFRRNASQHKVSRFRVGEKYPSRFCHDCWTHSTLRQTTTQTTPTVFEAHTHRKTEKHDTHRTFRVSYARFRRTTNVIFASSRLPQRELSTRLGFDFRRRLLCCRVLWSSTRSGRTQHSDFPS